MMTRHCYRCSRYWVGGENDMCCGTPSCHPPISRGPDDRWPGAESFYDRTPIFHAEFVLDDRPAWVVGDQEGVAVMQGDNNFWFLGVPAEPWAVEAVFLRVLREITTAKGLEEVGFIKEDV